MKKSLTIGVLAAMAVVIGWTAPAQAAAAPERFDPIRRDNKAQPRLSPSLRDDLAAGQPVRPASASGGGRSHVRVVVEAGTAAEATAAVEAAGGVVTTALQTMVKADVPAGALGRLSEAPGVVTVREPQKLRPNVMSEGVANTGANAWQSAGLNGTGVKVAVLDVGFTGYTTKLGTELPASVETDLGRCANPFQTAHGAAVAEIVHDVAPSAPLRLVCVEDDVDVVSALSTFQANGVRIVNASIGNDLSGRGDGSGGPDTEAGAVAALRKQGILYVAAAGNTGDAHFHANAVGGDGINVPVQLTSHGTFNIAVPGNGTAALYMRWDAWPRTNLDFDVYVGNTTCGQVGFSDANQADAPGGLEPIEAVFFTNCSASPQVFEVFVDRYRGSGTPRLDLFFYDVAAIERLTASSISDPAASPAALAVGSACQVANLQPYSSRGPTIDERVKPDIVAPDATSSSVYGPASGCSAGFTGTSAAAPHVSGAASLLLQANPGLQVAEVQQLLEDWAVDLGAAGKDSETGSGHLHLNAPSTTRPPTPQPFSPATPVRLFDSRPGPLGAAEAPFGASGRTTPVTGGTEVAVQVAGIAGVPADASAVLLNLTVTDTTAASFLTVYPGGTRPNTSNVNFAAGGVVATHVTATVGADDRVRVFNASGAAHVIVDVAGWYGPTGTGGPATARFTPRSAPARAFDSRAAEVGYAETGGGRTTKLVNNEDVAITVAGLGGVPADATGVVMNVTVTEPAAGGFLTVYPAGAARPLASNLNWGTAQTVANLVVGSVGTAGQVRLFVSGGPTHVIVDVIGWFQPNLGAGYVALDPPVRDLDTRFGNGPRLGAIGAGQSYDLQVGGYYGVPTDAAAVMLGVIAIAPSAAGFLTIYPAGPRPLASNLNFTPGAVVPNAVVAGLGTGGAVSFFNSTGATSLVSDLAGYFLDPANVPQPVI
jgi:subtilisin family serine protease